MLVPFMRDMLLHDAVTGTDTATHPVRVMAVQTADYVQVHWYSDQPDDQQQQLHAVWLRVTAIKHDRAGREYLEAVTVDRFGANFIPAGTHVTLRHANISQIKFFHEVPHE